MTLTIDDLLPALTKDMESKKVLNKNTEEPKKPVIMKEEPQWGALGSYSKIAKNEDKLVVLNVHN